MKVGFTTYPTAFQSKGGLEVQIRQSAAALRERGVDVEIVELYNRHLSEFDLIHHFSLNHASFRITAKARSFGIPTVVTPLVTSHYDAAKVWRYKLIASALYSVLGPEFRTRWHDIMDGLRQSDAVCPLTAGEKRVVEKLGVCEHDRIYVVPNGVTDAFFDADAAYFRERNPGMDRFILIAGSVLPYKNQLPVIQAARDLGYHTALLGSIWDRKYFDRCMQRGGDFVTYLGEYPYPSKELTSAFAAASLVVLASTHEAFGLTPFEALAAGTPSALTKVSGVDLPAAPPYFQRVNPTRESEIRRVIEVGMAAPRDRAACRQLVEDMRWSNVAKRIIDVYQAVMAARQVR